MFYYQQLEFTKAIPSSLQTTVPVSITDMVSLMSLTDKLQRERENTKLSEYSSVEFRGFRHVFLKHFTVNAMV